jgi:hypothetical protein
MTSHEIFAGISRSLALEILEYTFANDKVLYRATLEAIAQSRKLRAVFLERQPRTERHGMMIGALSRPALDLAADGLIRNWLLKKHFALLTDFLDALKISHEKGVVENLPPSVDDSVLQSAIEALLAKYPPEIVTLYLHAFNDLNGAQWENLQMRLQKDHRLTLGGDSSHAA